jgi:hypothetical protein
MTVGKAMGLTLALAGALLVAAPVYAWRSSSTAEHQAARPATEGEQKKIGAEVRLTLSALADSPDYGFGHGTEVVLAPICVSTVDSRYAYGVLNTP